MICGIYIRDFYSSSTYIETDTFLSDIYIGNGSIKSAQSIFSRMNRVDKFNKVDKHTSITLL